MTSSEDTEITLGTGKLLVLFFGLVAICAVFFGLGYSLGRKSEPTMAATSAAVPQTTPTPNRAGSATAPAPAMTFYKSVEQKDANAQLTPASDANASTTAAAAAPANGSATTGSATPAPGSTAQTAPANQADSVTTLPTSGYFVQVAAVSKQEDADSLVEALKAKQYPAFVAPQSAMDKLFRVQLGPYADVKDAEAMRTRLIADGYSPILKK
jgi:DedD protein